MSQNRLRRLIGYRHNVARARMVQQCQEHIQLLDLLAANKLPEAAEFLRKHLDSAGMTKTAVDRAVDADRQNAKRS